MRVRVTSEVLSVKTLPDNPNPNLDHLRQQAKDLLAGLRDGDPAASLAGAQASLAEQYGFRTWTELKAEVERRCGQADVADSALAILGSRVLGGLNWSSQHLHAEVREWDDHHAGLPRGRDGRRCVRRVDRQWRDESISSGSGQRSPEE